eukprot:m.223597 g.223597  ORF g.223597 m.223597 type:complete len:126 (-) comp17272_c1_seq24:1328-1705(-)
MSAGRPLFDSQRAEKPVLGIQWHIKSGAGQSRQGMSRKHSSLQGEDSPRQDMAGVALSDCTTVAETCAWLRQRKIPAKVVDACAINKATGNDLLDFGTWQDMEELLELTPLHAKKLFKCVNETAA